MHPFGPIRRLSPGTVENCVCRRGIAGRKAQLADLDIEALDAFINHLQQIRQQMDDIANGRMTTGIPELDDVFRKGVPVERLTQIR